MKKIITLICCVSLVFASFAQKKKFKGLKLGEKFGKITAKLLTSKTADLSTISLRPTIVSGIYNLDANTSEAKFFPKGTVEGDYAVSVTFMKNEGVGMIQLDGSVTCDGKEMNYVGAGSYIMGFHTPFTESKTIVVTSSTGQKSSFKLKPIAPIELFSVNGDKYLPIVNLDEDITLEYNGNSTDGKALLKASMVTRVAGAIAFNKFADFPSTGSKVTIPKEALSNTEISGSTSNAGNFIKGENFFLLEKELVTEKENIDASQDVSAFGSASLYAKAYSSMPIIVRGK